MFNTVLNWATTFALFMAVAIVGNQMVDMRKAIKDQAWEAEQQRQQLKLEVMELNRKFITTPGDVMNKINSNQVGLLEDNNRIVQEILMALNYPCGFSETKFQMPLPDLRPRSGAKAAP